MTPPANFLSSSIGAASTAQSTAPFMIGDAFGGNSVLINGLPGQATLGPVGGSLNVTGRVKLVENFSPMPRDRVFFDYNDFQNVPLVTGTTVSDLNRYSPGFEKTFFDRWASIEVRMPIAQTLNTTISGVSLNNTHQGEFGDLFVSLKTLLVQTDTLAVSGGMSLSLPTANSITLVNYPAVALNQLQIQNRSVYLQPFLSYLWTPNDRFYMQSLVTTEFATNGSPVTLDFNGVAPQYLGRLNNQTYFNFSFSAGYWIYRNPCNRYVTAVSPIFELHQSQTISGSNVVGATSARGDVVTVGQTGYVFQLLNCTTGVNVQMGPLSSLLVGYTTPLGGGTDKEFSGEFRVLFNRRFGPQNRLTRPQF